MSVPFNKFSSFVQEIGRAGHNLNSDVIKVLFTNTAPVATNAVTADITQIANGNGYTTGGLTVGSNTYSQTSGTATFDANDAVLTASGSVGPLRYCALVNSTPSGGKLIGWFDYGSSKTLASGETFTVSWNSSGILTLA